VSRRARRGSSRYCLRLTRSCSIWSAVEMTREFA
jgi:hypothetical protein